jgi:hypothetical protein
MLDNLRLHEKRRYVLDVVPVAVDEALIPEMPKVVPRSWRAEQKLAPDLSSALWLGDIHHFTPQQGLAVKTLWDALQSGLPDVHQRDILARAGSREAKLKKLFDGSSAWGKMIFPSRDFGGRAGFYRLAPPPEKRDGIEA